MAVVPVDAIDSINEHPTVFLESRGASQVIFDNVRFADWYGNLWLHHAYARSEWDDSTIRRILMEYPDSASVKNQFGRLALHYCLDRCRSVKLESVQLLLEFNPEGAFEKDHNNESPYDLAVKWKHSEKILLALLDVDPSQDYERYIKLKYGCFWRFIFCCPCICREPTTYQPDLTVEQSGDFEEYLRTSHTHEIVGAD